MRSSPPILLACGLFTISTLAATAAWATPPGREHAVFVMTNDAIANEVVAYQRSEEGTLLETRRYRTGGRGSGGTIDPLISQGSLTLSDDGSLLFAVNAGSGTLSAFRVDGARLQLSDEVPTQGSEPNAVAQHGELVYVLNTAASSSVVGFRIDGNHLRPIPDSLRYLSGNAVTATSITFSPGGDTLYVAERGPNQIDAFRVQPDGTLAPFVATPSAGPGLFALVVAPNGTVIAAETGGGGSPSAMSSYFQLPDGHLQPVTVGLPTLGNANCWDVLTPDGRFVYAANAASSSIAGFEVGGDGSLSPIPGTIVGINPAGSITLDLAVSRDGRFLYSVNGASGTVGMFAIRSDDGSLVNLGTVGGLPAAAGLNGIAAN